MSGRKRIGRRWTYAPWVLVLMMLFSTAGGRVVAAATPEAELQARRLFEAAEEHFRNGLFAEALAKYQAGYQIAPLPGFLINIAQCERRLGRLAVAQATYRKFIMVAPDSPFVPQVKTLIAELEALTQELAEPSPVSETKPETTVPSKEDDPKPPAPAPPEPSVETLVVVPAAPVVQTPAKTRWWLWSLIGAGVVGAVTTIVLVSLPPGTKTLHDGSVGTLRR